MLVVTIIIIVLVISLCTHMQYTVYVNKKSLYSTVITLGLTVISVLVN